MIRVLLLAMFCVISTNCVAVDKSQQDQAIDNNKQTEAQVKPKVVRSKLVKKNTKTKMDIGIELDQKLNSDSYSKYRNVNNDPKFGFYSNNSKNCDNDCGAYRSKLVGQSRAMAEVQDSVSGFSSFNTGPYPMERGNSKSFGANDSKIYGFRTSFPVGGPGSSK